MSPPKHEILQEAAELIDAGVLRTTLAESRVRSTQRICVAHQVLESGRTIGKLVLEGFG